MTRQQAELFGQEFDVAVVGGGAAGVRPGGTLLIVGHHPSDLETSMGRPHLSDLMFTADQVAAALDPDDWHIVVAAAPERQSVDPDGRPITIRDAVVRAIRRHPEDTGSS